MAVNFFVPPECDIFVWGKWTGNISCWSRLAKQCGKVSATAALRQSRTFAFLNILHKFINIRMEFFKLPGGISDGFVPFCGRKILQRLRIRDVITKYFTHLLTAVKAEQVIIIWHLECNLEVHYIKFTT